MTYDPGQKYEWAPDDRLGRHGDEAVDDFIRKVLRMDPHSVLVTDESTLWEFPAETEVYATRLREAYGVELNALPDDRLTTIMDAIAARRSDST
jgi:hypothetical protein